MFMAKILKIWLYFVNCEDGIRDLFLDDFVILYDLLMNYLDILKICLFHFIQKAELLSYFA